jgi:hypothetical protein
MPDDEEKNQCALSEVQRLWLLVSVTKETLMGTIHHLFLAATVCDQVGFEQSGAQMREMIDRLRLLAEQLDGMGRPPDNS